MRRLGGVAAIALGVLVALVPVNLLVVQDSFYGSYERYLDPATWPGFPAVYVSVALQVLISVAIALVTAAVNDRFTWHRPSLARLCWSAGMAAAAFTLLAAMVTAQVPAVAELPAYHAGSVALIDLVAAGARAAAWWFLGAWSLLWGSVALRTRALPRGLVVLVLLGGVGGLCFFTSNPVTAPGPLSVLAFAVCGWGPWLGFILLRRAATPPAQRSSLAEQRP
jgi:hypothetical protein